MKKHQRHCKRGGSGRAHHISQNAYGTSATPPLRSSPTPRKPSAIVLPDVTEEHEPCKNRSCLDDIISNEAADAFNKHMWYPAFMTTSIKSLTHFMFWHSVLFTFVTPLQRYLDGIWKEVVPTYWLWNQVDRHVLGGSGVQYSYTYLGSEEPRIDNAFVMHALAGLAWLVCGWLQIAVVSKKFHARFAWISTAALIAHFGYALQLLFVDQQKHMTLNKLILVSLAILALAYFAVGTAVGVAGHLLGNKIKWPGAQWRKMHTDMMFRGWIWSISGAGPIRMVVSVMHPLGFGPIRCQEAHGSLASDCLWPYLGRMMMVATWNQFVTGAYCKIRQDTHLTKTYLANLVLHVVMCASFWLMSLYGDESSDFISRLSGAPATDFSWTMTWIGIVVELAQLTVYFPRQFVVGAFAAPATMIAFFVTYYCF